MSYRVNPIKNTSLFFMAIFQITGILFYFSLSKEPSIWITALLSGISTVMTIYNLYKKSRYLFYYFCILFFSIGFSLAKIKTHAVAFERIKKETYIHNVPAYVLDINKMENQKLKIIMETASNHRKLSLISLIKSQSQIQPGDKVTFSGKLYPVKNPNSKYSYDLSRMYYFKKIYAQGIITSKINVIEKNAVTNLSIVANRIRGYMYEKMERDLSKKNAPLSGAIVLGNKNAINKHTKEKINLIGISHLFAISGMHLSVVASIIIFTIQSLLCTSGRIALKYNTGKIACILAIPFVFFYLIISGLQDSTLRAFIMLSTSVLANIVEESYSAERSLILAILLISCVEPEEVLNPGLQLSFIVVFALIKFKFYMSRNIKNKFLKIIVYSLGTSIIATLAATPFIAYHFNNVPLSGVITNMVAIPIVTHMIIPSSIIYMSAIPFNLEPKVSIIQDLSLSALNHVINFFSDHLSYSIYFHSFPGVYLIPYIFFLKYVNSKNKKISLLSSILIIQTAFGMFTGNKIPDLIVSSKLLSIKGEDNKLYFPQKRTNKSTSKERSMEITSKEPTFLKENNNICVRNVCMYEKNNMEIYIITDNFRNNTLLFFKNKKWVKKINIKDGVYYATISGENMQIKNALSDRPWHDEVQDDIKKVRKKKKSSKFPTHIKGYKEKTRS